MTKRLLLGLVLLMSHVAYGQVKVGVDTTITGFHYAANFQGTHVYTPHGLADLKTSNPSVFSYTIMPNATYQDARKQLDYLLNMAQKDGYANANVLEKDTTVRGKQVYYTAFTQTLAGQNYNNLVFYAFYQKGNSILLFISGDLDNGKYLQKIKKTFYTLQY